MPLLMCPSLLILSSQQQCEFSLELNVLNELKDKPLAQCQLYAHFICKQYLGNHDEFAMFSYMIEYH